MLPRIDFPDLLLEVAQRTSLASAFTHVSGADAHLEGFETSLCALILAEACNVGLVLITTSSVPALTRARLMQVDQGYFRAENIATGTGLSIEAQAGGQPPLTPEPALFSGAGAGRPG